MSDAKRGADHLVDALKEGGVETIFSLSGNQIMPVYDGLIGSGIRLVHTRHEGGAVYMAEAHAQMTGKVGVALLTAGPGFANGLSAMYSAQESQTPIIVMTGDSPVALDGRGVFQEMDQQTPAGALAKASYRIARAADAYPVVRHAMALAADGTPGPVHVSLPDDILREIVEADGPPTELDQSAIRTAETDFQTTAIDRIRSAKRPLILAGPQFTRPAWKQPLVAAAEATNIPIVALESPRGMRAPRIGSLASVLAEADVVVLLGLAANFLVGFGAAPTFSAHAHFVCVDEDSRALEETRQRLGPSRVTTIAMDGASAWRALHGEAGNDNSLALLRNADVDGSWRSEVEQALHWRPPEWADIPTDTPPFHAAKVAEHVGKFLNMHPATSLIIDGGEVGQWCQAVLDTEYSIINGPSGAIGGSIPYAMAAKAARPDQPVIAMLGDGTAGFYFMEFETALREELPFVAIVGNDAKWNAEHQIQVRDYGENRAFGCEMVPTRYDEVAKAMGCYGENVVDLGELVPAIERAIASGKPACINVEIQSNAAPTIKRP